MDKRLVVAALAATVIAIASAQGQAQTQTFPVKPVTMIVPFPAGGGSDILARIIAERMKATLGQPVIVENVGGAGGTIGTARVARSAPDGYTIGFGQWTSHVGSGALYPLTFDLLKDLTPVAPLTTAVLWLIGRGDLPANNLKELIAWLKANPDKATRRHDRRRQRHAALPDLSAAEHRHEVPARALSRHGSDLAGPAGRP